MDKERLVRTIEHAFRGVTLEDGVSLRQTEVMDRYGEGTTVEEFQNLPRSEVTNNWERIPVEELDRANCLAHLDAKGFRYYIPALMIRLLDDYDPGSSRTISTLSHLYPKPMTDPYALRVYACLDQAQNVAIAHYLQALPDLVDLDIEDQKIVKRALRNHWAKFLPAVVK